MIDHKAKDFINIKITNNIRVEFWFQWLGTQRMTYLIDFIRCSMGVGRWGHETEKTEIELFLLGFGVVLKIYK